MAQETASEPTTQYVGAFCRDHLLAGTLLLFLSGLASAITIILIHDGRGLVIPIALMSGVLLLGLEHLEGKRSVAPMRGRYGYLASALLIAAVTLVIYLPTLHIYFFSDDIGYLHTFYKPSLNQLLRIFHTDLAQVVEGESGQEIRPFYALFYMVSYKLWGLDPVGYHLIAILVHIINSIIVFRIANELAPGNAWRAGLAGLLFAVQPVHSMAVSWITGSPAEGFPTLFYLVAFLCFMRYRATSMARYLGLSMLAFSACLMCKEIAVTLPIMLVSYDLFRKLEGESRFTVGIVNAPRKTKLRFLLPYLPFILLIAGYLVWRHIVFSHFLAENFWDSDWRGVSPGGAASPTAHLKQFLHFGRFLGGLQVFNLRAFLLTLPTLALAVTLGLYMVWAISILRNRSEGRRAFAIILSFGLGWYLISNIPLLAAAPEARHLYLPAVGPCIAAAFLAMPTCFVLRKEAGFTRLLGVVLLVILCGCQLRKENRRYVQIGETTERDITQMAATAKSMPAQTLVIIQLPSDAFLPFTLQRPFASTYFYSRALVIESPAMSDTSLPEWWGKTKQILEKETAGTQDAPREVYLLGLDEHSHSLRLTKRILPGELIRACVTRSLGVSADSLDSVSDDEAGELVKALATLVLQGA